MLFDFQIMLLVLCSLPSLIMSIAEFVGSLCVGDLKGLRVEWSISTGEV